MKQPAGLREFPKLVSAESKRGKENTLPAGHLQGGKTKKG